MIQRIQTLYLLLAAICVGATLLTPLANYTDGESLVTLRAFMFADEDGVVVQPALYMGILLALSALVPFVTIFLFKRRMLQIRLCVAELVLLVGSQIMIGIYAYFLGYKAVKELPFSAFSIEFWAIMPIVAIIFIVLALRAIFRDELLIRSLNRIR